MDKEKMSKISVEINRDMYIKFKIKCVTEGISITKAVNQLIEHDLNGGDIISNSKSVKTEPVKQEKQKIGVDF